MRRRMAMVQAMNDSAFAVKLATNVLKERWIILFIILPQGVRDQISKLNGTCCC